MELEITHDEQEKRVIAAIEDEEALIDYRMRGDNLLVITHTFVPKSLEGRGIAGALTKYLLNYARANELKVKPVCPYAVAYFKRYPEYNDLLN